VNFTQAQYPGLPASNPVNAYYTEMLEIGYRYYQSHNVKPKFAFGHGLSYTTFSYTNLQVYFLRHRSELYLSHSLVG
jgi:beta-glucosidase